MKLRFNEDDHTYWVGTLRVPGVSSITGQLDDFSGIPAAVLERKSQIGKAAHAAFEIIGNGGEVDPVTVHEAVRPYVEAFQLFLSENPVRVVMTEQKVFSERYFYAGMLDAVLVGLERKPGFWEKDQFLLPDYKTVAQLRPTTGPQTAGYRLALPDMGVPRTQIQRLALQFKPDATYHIKAYNDSTDEACFLGLLAAYKWRMKNGLV